MGIVESWYKWPDERIEAYIRKHENSQNEEMIDRIVRMEKELSNRQSDYDEMGHPDSPSLQDLGLEWPDYGS